eukprot:c5927_g1_i1.p1 GENE.c5927_g1_i1~~c5927_g1_i1.p1  ORF type:complete len:348 (+),score=78.92 c5927_g1_i1:828-1871(+)
MRREFVLLLSCTGLLGTQIEGAAAQCNQQVNQMFDELFDVMSRYRQAILSCIKSYVTIAVAQHQGVLNLIDKSRAIIQEIKVTQDNSSTRDKLSIKQRANKLQKVLEGVALDRVLASSTADQHAHFNLDVDAVLSALHQSATLRVPHVRSSHFSSTILDGALEANMLSLFQIALGRIPSTFDLLHRGSRDGFTAGQFHANCDADKISTGPPGPTLTVIRDKNGNVFGGYSTAPWASGEGSRISQAAKSVFIFSLRGPSNPSSPALFQPTVNPCLSATSHYADHGPVFGRDGNELGVYENMTKGYSYSFGAAYKLVIHPKLAQVVVNDKTLAGSNTFVISEIEVFQCT